MNIQCPKEINSWKKCSKNEIKGYIACTRVLRDLYLLLFASIVKLIVLFLVFYNMNFGDVP